MPIRCCCAVHDALPRGSRPILWGSFTRKRAATTISGATTTPSMMNELRHPWAPTMVALIMGKMTMPVAGPAARTPDISERRFTNHLATMDIRGAQTPHMPTPATRPYDRYKCQGCCTRETRAYPRPRKIPQTNRMARGPKRSLNLPTTTANAPITTELSVKALEILARVHPNSPSIGARNTPKERLDPQAVVAMTNAAATTI